jgi:protein associated with RNAse G/E
MGYAGDPEYECLEALVEAERCLVADMELATLAYQHMRGVGGKVQDSEQARQYALQYEETAVPVERYRPGIFAAPEVLVKGPISASQLTLASSFPEAPDSRVPFSVGELLQVTASRYDGTPYRWWEAQVERVTPGCVVTFASAGGLVNQPDGGWRSPVSVRTFYWTDRLFNLSEVYATDTGRSGLYVHIASTPRFGEGGLRYHDHELDVVQYAGETARVVDEDEFAEAVKRYGYSTELQANCRQAVAEALQLVDRWIWPGRKVNGEQ